MEIQDNWHIGLKIWQRGRKERGTMDTNMSALKTGQGQQGRSAKKLHLAWEPGLAKGEEGVSSSKV